MKRDKKTARGGIIFTPNTEIDLEPFQFHLARYAFAIELVKGKCVLDVACGCGYGSRYLLDKGTRMVIGGDIDPEVVECAQRFWRRPSMKFILLDATRLPFSDDSFEAIISMETIEHLEQYEDYLSECKRVLKQGGVFICSTPYRGYGVPGITTIFPLHVHEFSPQELRELLRDYFREIRLYGQGYWHKRERKRWELKFKTEKMASKVSPKFEIMGLLYKRLLHTRRIRLSQIADWNKILNEKHKPFPLVSGSPIPKDIIAVARK
jgi:ubiquinone/menaquinone biosynthesis C-methylase UbiE